MTLTTCIQNNKRKLPVNTSTYTN